MKLHKYKVDVDGTLSNNEIFYDSFEVEAENEERAREKARDILFDNDTPQGMMYKHGKNLKHMGIPLITQLD